MRFICVGSVIGFCMVVDEVGDVCVKAVVVEFTSNIKTINHVFRGEWRGSRKGELKIKM